GGTPDSAVDGSYGLVTGPDAYTLPSTYHTSFIANGTDDVVLRFAMYAGAITNEVHNQIFAMNGFELVSLIAAHTPDPANEETGVALDLSDRVRVPGHLSWLAPTSSTITQILGYDLYLDPNETFVANRESFCLIAQTGLANTVTQYDPADFDWGVTYHWVVDVHYKTGGPTDPNVYVGEIDPPWWFRAIGAGPEVDAGDDLVTALEFLPANLAGTVTDATNDVASVAWSIAGYPGDPVAAVMQMIDRGGNDNSAIPDLLRDWIGSDTRSPGDPLILTLSGLPAGDYTWTSYHHDPENQTGQFDATVMDATGSTTTLNIDITDRNLADPNAFTRFIAPIVSDGSDVRLVFHQRASTPTEYAFFVMNGFHLMDDEGGLMNIDFGQPTTPVKAGYQAYLASHEVPATFTPQDFSAFGATVTISVAWGPHALGLINASVTKTNADLYAPTADFTTDYAGTYVIQLEATDSEGSVGSDTLEVAVAEEPCTAAQMVSTWPGFNYYDRDEDCDVDMLDFVPFASQWLEDRSLTGQVED
ncbi:MAG: hypothetical protein JW810_02090, partial [Sedimentisphaerales bacterium]|nr:hypothetical protein [Sedimentisphaerales bacterium]